MQLTKINRLPKPTTIGIVNRLQAELFKMKSHQQFLKRTIDANPKIKIVFTCFLKLNIDMHPNTIKQFIILINMIIIYLKKSEFLFKNEVITVWKNMKYKIQILNLFQIDQTYYIEDFIDDFIRIN